MKGLLKVKVLHDFGKGLIGYMVLHEKAAVEDCYFVLDMALRNWDLDGEPDDYKAVGLLLPMEFL